MPTSNLDKNDEILTINMFEVGHGDSILLTHEDPRENQSFYILIDSNTKMVDGKRINPVFEHLKGHGVRYIDLLVITHLHRDHYRGIDQVLNNLEVKKLVISPFISQKAAIFDDIIYKYKQKIGEICRLTSNENINFDLKSLAVLLRYIAQHDASRVMEAGGPEQVLRIPSAHNSLKAYIYLPLKKIKGVLHNKIERNDFNLDSFPEMNDASVVVVIDIFGHRLLFGGDSTAPQWREHRRHMKRDGVKNLGVNIIKAPHHGSDRNNPEDIFKYFFHRPNCRDPNIFTLISADGRTHPHKAFLERVGEWKLKPLCTNYSRHCLTDKITSIEGLASIPLEARPFLKQYEKEEAPIPCLGNIELRVSKDGITWTGERKRICPYRLRESDGGLNELDVLV